MKNWDEIFQKRKEEGELCVWKIKKNNVFLDFKYAFLVLKDLNFICSFSFNKIFRPKKSWMLLTFIKVVALQCTGQSTDKDTDVSWDIFIIWKIISGLWAGLWKKGLGQLWATFEASFLKFSWVNNQSKFLLKILQGPH